MSRRLRDQQGQTATECMGMLLIVALIIAALFMSDVPGKVVDGLRSAVCSIAGAACPEDADARTEPVRTQPPAGDRDGDGASDARERELGLDPDTADSDGDRLPDGAELELGADARNPDTDGDGLSDSDEADSDSAMNPNDDDSDDDGLTDAEELAVGSDPSEADSDGAGGAPGDGLTDAEEIEHGTDPNTYDTDGDFWPDGEEVERGTDPTKDERSLVEKGLDLFLDDPFTLGKGTLIKGGAKKVIDRVVGKGGKAVRKIDDAKSVDEAAQIRRDRLDALRENKPTGARPTVGALTRQQDTALEKVMDDRNRLEHIFGQGGKHNLEALTRELGSQRAVVREAILRIPRDQPEGVFKLTTRIGEHEVTVTGNMIDGVPRVSNLWVP